MSENQSLENMYRDFLIVCNMKEFNQSELEHVIDVVNRDSFAFAGIKSRTKTKASKTAHITPINIENAKLVAWHTELDIAGYEANGTDLLAIKGYLVNRDKQDVAPVGTQIAALANYPVEEAKLIVKRRYSIVL